MIHNSHVIVAAKINLKAVMGRYKLRHKFKNSKVVFLTRDDFVKLKKVW